MIEGVAQWTGLGAESVLGNIRLDQFIQYFHFDADYDSFYYAFGMRELYLLWKMNAIDFARLVRELKASRDQTSDIESIFRKKFGT